jgi:hypothetical protein
LATAVATAFATVLSIALANAFAPANIDIHSSVEIESLRIFFAIFQDQDDRDNSLYFLGTQKMKNSMQQ